MRYSLKFLIAIVLGCAAAASRSHAQEMNVGQQLAAGFAMENAGRPEAAIVAAQSLIDSQTLASVDHVRALDLEGISYEDLDQPEKAVHALEEARNLLGPQDHKEIAAVLNNMGGIYRAWGQPAIAEHLYERAFEQAKAGADHDDMARVANNQASMALAERKNRQGRKYLDRAEREAKRAADLDDDDRAAMVSMRGWLALNEGDPPKALELYRQALEYWREKHGTQHVSTAWGMLLVGQVEAIAGDRETGLRTMREGLALTATIAGEKSQRYAVAELAYARMLNRAGNVTQAAGLQQDAKTKLTAFENRNCNDCTISVNAVR